MAHTGNAQAGIKMTKSGIIISGDAESVNFREIRMGNIAPNTLYRSSHPIKDDMQERVIALLASNARIAAVINLCDFDADIKRKAFFAPWYNKLLKSNRVIALGMDFSLTGDYFHKKLKKGLQFIINTEGPWLIHCHAGIDRTGFVSIVLESLMGATLDEIINDYLQSFNSMYNSSLYGEVNKGDSLVVMQLLSAMGNYMPVNDQYLPAIAEHYLANTLKLSASEIALLKRKLAGITNNE
jgi:Protein tyrosine/serine phosphatase